MAGLELPCDVARLLFRSSTKRGERRGGIASGPAVAAGLLLVRSTDLFTSMATGQTRRRGGASRESAGVILDVPHILRKPKMRRYEALDAKLILRVFLRCKSCCKIASCLTRLPQVQIWFNRTKKRTKKKPCWTKKGQKKKSCCQKRPVVCCWRRAAAALGTVPRGPCSGSFASALRIRPEAIIALIIISSGLCTPALLRNDAEGCSSSS